MFKFEKLKIWQQSRKFVKDIYGLSQMFPQKEQYGLTSQINRSVVSIMLNIAEGSNSGSDKEFKRFLYMASRSLDEVVSCLYLALDMNFINQSKFEKLYQPAEELGKQVSSLKTFLNTSAQKAISP